MTRTYHSDMKLCKGCGLEKDPTLYYESNKSTCKECVKKRNRENRAEKLGYYREYDKARAMNPERVKARKDYLETDTGRGVKRKASEKYIQNNPKKRKAHIIIGNAVRDGKIVKASRCEVCGSDSALTGHHDDYDLPLEVRWLCAKCHIAWHKENGEGLNPF